MGRAFRGPVGPTIFSAIGTAGDDGFRFAGTARRDRLLIRFL
jgi:hypothetical protein